MIRFNFIVTLIILLIFSCIVGCSHMPINPDPSVTDFTPALYGPNQLDFPRLPQAHNGRN